MRSQHLVSVGLIMLCASCDAAPTHYVVTPGPQQSVRFDARTQMERYAGTTNQIKGDVTVDVTHPAISPSAHFDVVMSSLTTGNGSRDSNMRRSFLQTEIYPTATFTLDRLESSDVPLTAGHAVSGIAHGTFTLHGVTRTIAPNVIVTRETNINGHDALHIVAKFVVKLGDYKIATPRVLFFSVKSDHAVTIDLHAIAAPKNP